MTEIPQRLLGEGLLISARKRPDKTAIIVRSEEYTYSDLAKASLKLAEYLTGSGIKKGDRVAVYMNNSWESVVSVYGITIAGAVFLVINPQTKADKLQYILKDSGARILITESILRNELSMALEVPADIEEIIITGENNSLPGVGNIRLTDFHEIQSKVNGNITLQVIPNDLAALIYTSGSTGFPKGVMMTHQAMVFISWSLIEYLRLTDEDRIILLLPLAFDYGLYQLIMAITVGGSLIVEQSFTFPASVYKQINIHKPTVFPGVPTIYAMMIASSKKNNLAFDCIKKITNTAAALPAEFIPELKKVFPNSLIFRMYGLTECKRVCYLEPELVDLKPNSVGKAIPGTEVFLLSPDGQPVKPGENGILHVRGPHVMLGYWHKEDLSNEMLKPGFLPGERILCTNDWFRMDEEGFLYFQSRTDDIIKTRGEKVSPAEIENLIYKIPGIKEVAIIGVPDNIMGEAIIGFFTTHANANVDEKRVIKECMSKLELFMVPKAVIALEAMPKSSNSKIDKKELKKMYLENE